MKKLLSLLFLALAGQASAQQTASPCYWQGQLVKCFPTTGIYLDAGRSVRYGEAAVNGVNYVEVKAPAALGSNPVMTLPEATDTFVGKATSDVFTNKTLDANGTGNSISNIENGDIAAAAAIAHTKLANITAGSVLMGNNSNVPTATALSGDVTVSDSGVTAIGSGVIVNADVNGSAAIDGSKIVSATNAVSGVVTTSSQNIAGVKTFYDGIKLDDAGGQTTMNYFVEGSWAVSPVVEGDSTSGTGTSATGVGRYTRIGNTVFFTAYVTYTTHTGTGNLQIGDLPFTPAASAFYSVSVYADRINGVAGLGLVGLIGNSSTKIRIYTVRDDDTPLAVTMSDNSDAQTHAIAVSGWYQI
jgi:hypothetical protein